MPKMNMAYVDGSLYVRPYKIADRKWGYTVYNGGVDGVVLLDSYPHFWKTHRDSLKEGVNKVEEIKAEFGR